ncbi:MAG: sulfite exporter TauE/SafE family protein, partial [Campylobacter sp.]
GSLISVRFGVALAQKIDRTVQKRCLLALISTTLIIMINKLFA